MSDNLFIVISGHNPQSGKRERISKVRAHIRKRHFLKLRNEAGIQKRQQSLLQSAATQKYAGRITIPKELPNLIPAGHALLKPTIFEAETTRRMHKFFDVHLRRSVDGVPFLKNVVRWTISDAYFMSAKLLNASGWDDVLEYGKVSPWTTRQRFITIRLLNDTFVKDAGAKTHVIIAALQSLLAFELLIGNCENINRLQLFYQGLMSQLIKPNNENWSFLIRADRLLSYADRIRRAGNLDNRQVRQYSNFQVSFPLDLSMFNLGQSSWIEDHLLIYSPLNDLYRIFSMVSGGQNLPLNRSDYDFLTSQHQSLAQYIPSEHLADKENFISSLGPESHDAITALRLSTLILTSSVLSDNEIMVAKLAGLASQLRSLLSANNYPNWNPLQGMLVWCLAIGLRFADPQRDRTWFLMQFLRVTHLCVLEAWDVTSRSLEVLVGGLERIGRVSIITGVPQTQ